VTPTDPTAIDLLIADLGAEQSALDHIVADIGDEAWDTPTPSAGWTVRDQIGHLTYFDRAAALAVNDPLLFAAERDAWRAGRVDDVTNAETRVRTLPPPAVLAEWRTNRDVLLGALESIDASSRIEWYGPSMSGRSFVTARLMETWAHGLDVADALARPHPATDRLRHVAHLGVATRGWSFVARGLTPPDGEVRIELTPPGGGPSWTWGDAEAADRVEGPALDFCQVVTQRRLPADTELRIDGPVAKEWMANAQAFAGPPTITDTARGRGGGELIDPS
jgi:uncharacterized protein (TIGR03084 family)